MTAAGGIRLCLRDVLLMANVRGHGSLQCPRCRCVLGSGHRRGEGHGVTRVDCPRWWCRVVDVVLCCPGCGWPLGDPVTNADGARRRRWCARCRRYRCPRSLPWASLGEAIGWCCTTPPAAAPAAAAAPRRVTPVLRTFERAGEARVRGRRSVGKLDRTTSLGAQSGGGSSEQWSTAQRAARREEPPRRPCCC